VPAGFTLRARLAVRTLSGLDMGGVPHPHGGRARASHARHAALRVVAAIVAAPDGTAGQTMESPWSALAPRVAQAQRTFRASDHSLAPHCTAIKLAAPGIISTYLCPVSATYETSASLHPTESQDVAWLCVCHCRRAVLIISPLGPQKRPSSPSADPLRLSATT
jgi:hypothetical protein